MNNKDFVLPRKTYFAAANGYSGFRSYFSQLFNPNDYERIFILKGGPGTGKSSLMKKLISSIAPSVGECEAVLCSSDPDSLDGAVFINDGKRVAVLDGTAPHTQDPIYPGACEEIVNLGECWDDGKIIENRKTIIRLGEEKKSHYDSAYFYLRLAGEIYAKISKIIEASLKENSLEEHLKFLADLTKKSSKANRSTYLLSAFGKSGYIQIKTDIFEQSLKFRVTNKQGEGGVLLGMLRERLTTLGVSYTVVPSPFSDSVTEGIYIDSINTFVSVFDLLGAEFVDVDLSSLSELETDMLLHLEKLHEHLLSSSRAEFVLAAQAHAAIEGIYTPSMDFLKVEEKTNEILSKILYYLG